jgi:phosphoribosylamine--glycine ligase
MGAFAPMGSMTNVDVDLVMTSIVAPTLEELRRRGIDFRGVLYAGVMRSAAGPKLLEYNVRFGDPETQVLVPLYGPSLFDFLSSVARGQISSVPPTTGQSAVTVVIAAQGYPESPRQGDVIEGLGDDGQLELPIEGVTIFHAGTSRDADGRFVTNGGRVLAVTATGDTLVQARERAYAAAEQITFDGRVMRHDIARSAS